MGGNVEGDMRRVRVIVAGFLLAGWGMEALWAAERSIEDLPNDVWDLAFVWTEPIKEVARETRRFDPISGLWFGLLEGAVKSIERTADVFLPHQKASSPSSTQQENPALLRYTF